MQETVLELGVDELTYAETSGGIDLWYDGDELHLNTEGGRIRLEPTDGRDEVIEVENKHLSTYIDGTEGKEAESIEEAMFCEVVREDGDVLAVLKMHDIVPEEEFPTGRNTEVPRE